MPQSSGRSRVSSRRARRCPRRAALAVTNPIPASVGAELVPLADRVRDWLIALLAPHGYHRPVCKRLALLVTGLLAGYSASVAGLAETLRGLEMSPATEPSIVRRIQRLEADPRLDPAIVLPLLFRALLPTLVQSALTAHAANQSSGAAHHRRFIALRLVVDSTTKADQVVVLTVGLAYQGIVLPLGLRTWEQNVPLPHDEYMTQLTSLLSEIQAELPPDLRDHVLLVADRGFGSPRLVDLARALHWHWLLRVQYQTMICSADGQMRPLREVAPTPGSVWAAPAEVPLSPDTPIAAFKGAGWRPCQVVAVWLPREAEPWLLLTDLDASLDRLWDYAQRWAIERLFLSWKSHGLDLEQVGLSDPLRIRHLLTGMVIATLWRLAAAVARAPRILQKLATHAPTHGTQFRLRLWPTTTPLPWPGKFSLFTWGTKTFRHTPLRTHTPALRWAFEDWNAPRWSQLCHDAYYGVT